MATDREHVKNLTGLSDEELTDLGGFDSDHFLDAAVEEEDRLAPEDSPTFDDEFEDYARSLLFDEDI